MTALEELAVAVPRPDALCQRYARRMDPWWGFVLAGAIFAVLWFAVVVIIVMTLGDALGFEPGSLGAQITAIASLVVGAASGFLVFRWWRRRRLEHKEKLVRAGALVEVAVTGRPLRLTGSNAATVVDLEAPDRQLRCAFNRWFSPNTGDTMMLLHHPGVPHVAAFDRNGSMYAGHVQSRLFG